MSEDSGQAAPSWVELEFSVDHDHADALGDALLEHGALSVQVLDGEAGTPAEQPVFGEPGMTKARLGWRISRFVMLADNEPGARMTLQNALSSLDLPAMSPAAVSVRRLAAQDWVSLTQSQFDPIAIGERLWITPSWHRDAPGSGERLVIELDPGMAFGTGSHPTTRLCLGWLDANVRGGESVIDYGCGSGILAIAASRLGATDVTGIDIDEHAVASARDNARKNAVSIKLASSRNDLPVAADIVLANILASPLKLLAPLLQELVRPGGHLLLAGLLDAQVEEVMACYPAIALQVAASEDGWSLLAGQRRVG